MFIADSATRGERPPDERCLELRLHGDVIVDAAMTGGGLSPVLDILEGQDLQKAVAQIPILLPRGRTGHGLAAIAAAERALGVKESAEVHLARDVLGLTELIATHAEALLAVWPEALGLTPDHDTVLRIGAHMEAVRGHLMARRERWTIGGGRVSGSGKAMTDHARAAERLAIGRIFGAGLHDPNEIEDLQAWALLGETPPARVLARLLNTGMAIAGRCDLPLLRRGDPGCMQAAFAQNPDFALAPHWTGRAVETGPLARMASHPLMADPIERFDNGILSRMAARLAELSVAVFDLCLLVEQVEPAPASAAADLKAGDGEGIGVLQTADGLLVHRIEIAGGRVACYEILAAQAWTAHPAGLMHQVFAGQAYAQGLKDTARLIYATVDPGARLDVIVRDAAEDPA